jgi:hypothetical protein
MIKALLPMYFGSKDDRIKAEASLVALEGKIPKIFTRLGTKWWLRSGSRALPPKMVLRMMSEMEKMVEGAGSMGQGDAERSAFSKRMGLWGAASEYESERKAMQEWSQSWKSRLAVRRARLAARIRSGQV